MSHGKREFTESELKQIDAARLNMLTRGRARRILRHVRTRKIGVSISNVDNQCFGFSISIPGNKKLVAVPPVFPDRNLALHAVETILTGAHVEWKSDDVVVSENGGEEVSLTSKLIYEIMEKLAQSDEVSEPQDVAA